MAVMIALAWSDECEEELKRKGFKKTVVYTKHAPWPEGTVRDITKAQIELGTSEFFAMTFKPFQFLTSSWWGMGND